jgi:hypothetical protein
VFNPFDKEEGLPSRVRLTAQVQKTTGNSIGIRQQS